MLRVFVLFLFLISALPAFAQRYDAQGNEIKPEGPRGRYSSEQAAIFALKDMPGELLEESMYENDGRNYYEFVIEQDDGSVFELELNALTGQIYQIEVEKLGPNPQIPAVMYDIDLAKERAREYVYEHTHGKLKARVIGSELGVFERKLVYNIRVRKTVSEYEVIVDALKGKILFVEEL